MRHTLLLLLFLTIAPPAFATPETTQPILTSVLFKQGEVICNTCLIEDNVARVKAFTLELDAVVQADYDSYLIPEEYRGIFASSLLTGALSRWIEIPLIALHAVAPNDYLQITNGFTFTRHFISANDNRLYRATVTFVAE